LREAGAERHTWSPQRVAPTLEVREVR
jgi:hypothetical protein